MRRILYLTFYFEPDLCAGSFRNTPLATRLAAMGGDDLQVHVVTTQPNRYHSFKVKSASHEQRGNLIIDRVQLPAHKSGFSDQIRAFRAYHKAALQLTKGRKYDIVFASSSRMFTAYLGKVIASRLQVPLYLDIRDIFVDTMADVLKNPVINKSVVNIVKNFVERPTFRYASHINLISEGFKPYFDQYPSASYSYFPNGIDEEFDGLEQDPGLPKEPYIITYAGNMGEGQGLHKIIPMAAKMLGKGYQFRLIGDGGTRKLLEQALSEGGIENVTLLNPMNRKQIIDEYRKSHFLFLHLNDYEAFKKVLPSKIFEYGASNIPVIAGVGGFAAAFIKKNLSNALVFPPCDAKEFVRQVKSYHYKLEDRPQFRQAFSRNAVNEGLARSILSLLPSKINSLTA